MARGRTVDNKCPRWFSFIFSPFCRSRMSNSNRKLLTYFRTHAFLCIRSCLTTVCRIKRGSKLTPPTTTTSPRPSHSYVSTSFLSFLKSLFCTACQVPHCEAVIRITYIPPLHSYFHSLIQTSLHNTFCPLHNIRNKFIYVHKTMHH